MNNTNNNTFSLGQLSSLASHFHFLDATHLEKIAPLHRQKIHRPTTFNGLRLSLAERRKQPRLQIDLNGLLIHKSHPSSSINKALRRRHKSQVRAVGHEPFKSCTPESETSEEVLAIEGFEEASSSGDTVTARGRLFRTF